VLGGVQSAGDFASSAAVGLLWALVSPTTAFLYAAGWMAVSVLSARAVTPAVRDESTGTEPSGGRHGV
jgi:hypothetical protein